MNHCGIKSENKKNEIKIEAVDLIRCAWEDAKLDSKTLILIEN